MQDLKTLTGVHGGGIKFLDRVLPALHCLGEGRNKSEEVTKLRSEAVAVRQKGRLQVVCRSAAVILRTKATHNIKALEGEVKALKVTIPKKLQARLAALKASAGGLED